MTEGDESQRLDEQTTGHSLTRSGEEVGGDDTDEAGREGRGLSHADRPASGTTGRSSTGVNPEEPIDEEMVHQQAP